ncbi:hypothetical protein [Kitasatospora sp. NPDC008115]|uniref:hypothetical protein n=1 Tax=Kitasatospora sp. NPDC008115 TaxID=3364022 RepID=UPI0036E9FC89
MAQVAASALATVVGAVLASELGVYGTILGAAVVSIGATTGSAVFQHLFKRTGEQLRDAVDRTAGPGQLTNGLRQAPEPAPAADPPPVSGQWSTPRVVRARRRWTWKSFTAVSALVFTLAMVPILAFELATGQPVSATVKGESGSGTSIGGRVDRKPTVPPGDAPSSGPSSVPSPSAGGDGADGGASGRPSPGARPDTGGGEPSASPSAGSGAGPSTAPSASPSARPTGEPSAPPAPSASSAPSAPASDGAASTKPSGAATPKPPAPSTAAEPPPAAPQAPAGAAGAASERG